MEPHKTSWLTNNLYAASMLNNVQVVSVCGLMRFHEVFMRSQIFITHSQIDVYKVFYEVLGLSRKFFTKSHPTFPQTRTDVDANSYGRSCKLVWT